ncbi:MAG: hypothetical protein KJZ83_00160 [Burkholderiaceae bacterium]|nr:hypothetical protein [Burkholderiaceae bacterium]
MSLADALKDVKDEVVGGKELTDALFASIAAEYELNPKLLARKWEESGWTVEGLRMMAVVMDPARNLEKKIEEQINELCRSYRVSRDRVVQKLWNGQKVTVICHLPRANRWGYVAVKHSDASAVKLSWAARFETCN